MQFEYICHNCDNKGTFIELAYWTDGTYRCPKCFNFVNIENSNYRPYIKMESGSDKDIAVIIIDGFYIAGVQRHCIQLSKVFKESGFQVMIIAVEGGGAWYKRFISASDFLYIPNTILPVTWTDVEMAFGADIIHRIRLCSCHLVIPIQWGINEVPLNIKLFAHFHSEPSEHEIISPYLLERIYLRAERVLFPTTHTLNVYRSLSKADTDKYHVLYNGYSDNATLQKYKTPSRNRYCIKIGVLSRIDCDKFSFSLFENTIQKMIEKRISFKIIVAGNGDSMPNLELIVNKLNLNHFIHLIGFLDDPTPIYHWADLIFLPSKRESMPYVMIESIKFQIPIVLPMLGIAADNTSITGVFSFEPENENDATDKIILAKHFAHTRISRKLMLQTYNSWAKKWTSEVKLAYDLN